MVRRRGARRLEPWQQVQTRGHPSRRPRFARAPQDEAEVIRSILSRADKNRASPSSAPKQLAPPLGVAECMLRTRPFAGCFALLSYSFANNSAKVIPTHGAHVAKRHVDDVRAGKGRDLRRN